MHKNNKKLNVLIVSPMWPSEKKPYFGIFVKKFADELEKRGVNVETIINTDFRTGKLAAFTKYLRLYLNVITTQIDFDLIHLHYIFPGSMSVVRLALNRNVPLVVTPHGSDILGLWKLIPFGKWYWDRFFKADKAIIYVSKFLRDEAERIFGLNAVKNSHLISNGVDIYTFTPMPQTEVRKKLKLDSSRKIVLAVSNLIKIKSLETLILAQGAIEESHRPLVVIIGIGPLLKELEELARSTGVLDSIKFVGAQDFETMPLWFNACDIFVSPSVEESFGLALREAMACGKAVIASDIPPHLEAFENEKEGLFFKQKNHEELAEKIKILLSSDQLREYMGRNARARVQDLSWDAVMKKTFELYDSLLERKKDGKHRLRGAW